MGFIKGFVPTEQHRVVSEDVLQRFDTVLVSPSCVVNNHTKALVLRARPNEEAFYRVMENTTCVFTTFDLQSAISAYNNINELEP
jgi:hypothetical protein